MRRRLLVVGTLAPAGAAASLLLSSCGSGHPAAVPSPPATVPTATTTPTPTAAATATATPTRSPLVGGATLPPSRVAPSTVPAGTVGTVLFALGSTTVTADGAAVVRDAVAILRSEQVTAVTVLGYTDYFAGERVNADLSQQRADVVAALLRTALGSGVQVTTQGLGRDDPVARNSERAGREQNRRAVILAVG